MDKSPDAFRTISEVADLLETPAHVLRFWESRFPQIRPVKRAGGRRYYRPADVALLMGIRRLLHDEGMTIRGVQKILREHGVKHVSGVSDDGIDDADVLVGTALPVDEAPAPTARVIALHPVATPAPDAAPTPPPAEVDLFARMAQARAAAPHSPAADAPPVPPPQPVAATDTASDGDSDNIFAEAAPPPPPADAPEAPMQVWAEPAAVQSAVHDMPPTTPTAPIAQRLRLTRARDLAAPERASLTVLRARARSLRDRLGSAPRFGA